MYNFIRYFFNWLRAQNIVLTNISASSALAGQLDGPESTVRVLAVQ